MKNNEFTNRHSFKQLFDKSRKEANRKQYADMLAKLKAKTPSNGGRKTRKRKRRKRKTKRRHRMRKTRKRRKRKTHRRRKR